MQYVINTFFRGGWRLAFNIAKVKLSFKYFKTDQISFRAIYMRHHFSLSLTITSSCIQYTLRAVVPTIYGLHVKVNVLWPENPKCNLNVAPVIVRLKFAMGINNVTVHQP